MNWLKYALVIPAIVDLVKLIKEKRQSKKPVTCDDVERARDDVKEVVRAGKGIAKDVRKRKAPRK